jgi:hypothetical protein
MTGNGVAIFGITAAFLQVMGYVLYIREAWANAVYPNAVSWMMFAYGTWFLVFLEYQSGVHWALLALPIACAMMSFVIAGRSLAQASRSNIDWIDGAIFAADIVITAVYVALVLQRGGGAELSSPFLLLSAALTIATFVPILRAVWRSPSDERPCAWLVWSAAYAMLLCATMASDESHNLTLYAYPAVNVVLHVAMSILVMRRVPQQNLGAAV